MTQRLLYVREHPLDIPENLVVGRELLIAHNAADAISCVDRFGDSIEGYVLGAYLLQQGFTFEQADEIEARIRSFKVNQEVPLWDRKRDLFARKNLAMERDFYPCFDRVGGERVFRYLEEKGYVGEKPILFFTSQYGISPVVKTHKCRKIRIAPIPISPNDFSKLFHESFGNVL